MLCKNPHHPGNTFLNERLEISPLQMVKFHLKMDYSSNSPKFNQLAAPNNSQNKKPLYEYRSVEAEEYAEWVSIGRDLKFVIQATTRLIEISKLEDHMQDSVLTESLWSAALTTYARCFNKGKRKRLAPTLIYKELLGEPIATHQYYMDSRDKHTSHSVSAFEKVKVGLLLNKNPIEGLSVIGIGCLGTHRVSDCNEGVEQLKALAIVALKHAKEQEMLSRENALEKAKTLTKNELSSLKPLKITPQGGGQVAKTPRKKPVTSLIEPPDFTLGDRCNKLQTLYLHSFSPTHPSPPASNNTPLTPSNLSQTLVIFVTKVKP